MRSTLPYLCLSLMLAALWLTTASYSHFSQDSWSYFELSRHVFDDFYRISTWRQYHLTEPYGASFPPLWPVAIACFNAVMDIGIYAGFVMNFIIAIFTFYLLRRLAFALGHVKTLGSFWMLALLALPDYTTALFSAATLPMAIALTLVILLLLLHRPKLDLADSAALGVLAGLGVLLRFDFVPCALALAVAPLWFSRNRLVSVAVYLVSLLVSISPWVAYSYAHFGVWFVSDNSRTVLSATPIFVRDYYPEGVPMLWDAPQDWLIKTIQAKLKSADVMATAIGMVTPALLLLALMFRHDKLRTLPKPLWVFALMVVAQLSVTLITGFVETRYYVPLQLFLLIFITQLLFGGLTLPRYAPAIFLALSLIYATAYITKSLAGGHPISLRFNPQNQSPTEFSECPGTDLTQARLLLPPKNYSYKFGALTGTISYVAPTNLDRKNFSAFQKQFASTHILTDSPKALGIKGKPLCTIQSWGEVDRPFQLFRLSPPR